MQFFFKCAIRILRYDVGNFLNTWIGNGSPAEIAVRARSCLGALGPGYLLQQSLLPCCIDLVLNGASGGEVVLRFSRSLSFLPLPLYYLSLFVMAGEITSHV